MQARVIFIGDSFSSGDKQRLRPCIKKTALKAAKLLGVKNKAVSFTVYRFKGKTNLGFTKAKDWIEITIPPGRIDYRDLEGLVYHEMHHIARGYSAMLEKGEHTLLGSIFSEGLAVSFEVERVPGRLPRYERYVPSLIKKWLPRMAREFSSTTYDYYAWFHGQGKPDKIGYKIGKYLVDEIIKRHPSQTPAALARVRAKKLLKMSGYKER